MNTLTPLRHLLLPPTPAAPATATTIVAHSPTLSRAEFAQRALHLASALEARGIRYAAIWAEDAAEFATALFACWRAGTTAVLPADTAAHTCSALASQVDVWLTDTDLTKVVPAERQWPLHSALHQESGSPLPPAALDAQAEVILYTSGSNGTPKQIRKHLGQLQAEIDALQHQWSLSPDRISCVLGSVSVQHMYGLPFRVLWPLAAGVPLDRVQHAYPEALQHASLAHERAIWVASPALLSRLGDALDWAQLRGRLVRLYSAGGPLPASASDRFAQNLGAALRPTEIYGSSETGIVAFRQGADDWQPFAGVAVSLNSDGALLVQSPWVRPEEAQTADAATLTASGGFQLHGRLDRIVKIEGKRIALPMVENALTQNPLVAQVHLGTISPPNTTAALRQTPRLAALVALSAQGLQVLRSRGRTALVNALREPLRAQFAPLAVPRIWRFFAQLPLNAQGKLTQTALHDAVHNRPTLPDAQLQPLNANAPHERHYTVRIPYDLAHFSGHFPTVPVAPGVAQIGWAIHFAQQDLLPTACPCFRFGGMEVLKFQRLVRPGDRLHLALRFDAETHKLHFTFTTAAEQSPCSSGRIVDANQLTAKRPPP